ncbi:1-acyl-sn-glycerol-3-phosphate acyltransferase [Ehrlichia ruminantium]|uniref:1-acyl-sn-glycerol-3-phosphate acyltransferase n=3 Tax=Ehrlichia ruminantium TaxID=779 RepID=A0AAE6UIQ7_EHRRU|nr:1-acyl-sn-glycerol-3-phosphate acyltransferase [Ehrlichia ruminantium]QGR03884.1 1-acyl-sn-glycerol-3-phosphate acyltransferase [Ehrlichia ruminantium]QGR04809.1 1-acyl-sn-glycerol-3-phosphate acyltransferase [Ehrlichia ruminantium]
MLFYILLGLFAILYTVVVVPFCLILPMSSRIKYSVYGIKVVLFIERIIDGIDYEVRGFEHLPKDCPYIVASEHQSPLETLVLFTIFKNPVYILKKELMWLPIFGIYFMLLKMIFINRSNKIQALKHILTSTASHVKKGRTVIIFPQGSRVMPGTKVSIKPGITAIYSKLSVSVVPVAVNTGLFWPASIFSLKKTRGKAIIQILPPIYPGLTKQEFASELESRMSAASEALMKEARKYTETK